MTETAGKLYVNVQEIITDKWKQNVTAIHVNRANRPWSIIQIFWNVRRLSSTKSDRLQWSGSKVVKPVKGETDINVKPEANVYK